MAIRGVGGFFAIADKPPAGQRLPQVAEAPGAAAGARSPAASSRFFAEASELPLGLKL
jgi:hypothetical protein